MSTNHLKTLSTIIVLCGVLFNTALGGMLVCGTHGNKELYDNSTHKCELQKIVLRVQTTEVTMTTRGTPASEFVTAPTKPDVEQTQRCTGRERIEERIHCCGRETYDPYRSICCTNQAKSMIHHDKPEKDHVCCGLSSYRRGKQPCLLPASNDLLWTPKKFKSFKQTSACFSYVYRVIGLNIPNNTKSEDGNNLLDLQQILPKPSRGKVFMHASIQLDEHTPKKKIKWGRLLIVAEGDRSENNFFVHATDEVYRLTWKYFEPGKKSRRLKRLLSSRRRRKC